LRRAAPDLTDDPEVRRTTYHLLFNFVRGLDAMINTPGVRCLPAILEVEEYERSFGSISRAVLGSCSRDWCRRGTRRGLRSG
jgi:hypothetical protein